MSARPNFSTRIAAEFPRVSSPGTKIGTKTYQTDGNNFSRVSGTFGSRGAPAETSGLIMCVRVSI